MTLLWSSTLVRLKAIVVLITVAGVPPSIVAGQDRSSDLPSIVKSLNQLDRDIASGEAALAAAGPLVRDTVESRLAVLRLTRDWMRLSALAGQYVQFSVRGRIYNPEDDRHLSEALSKEIDQLDAEIVASSRRAQSEGAAGELAKVTLEALRLSHAMAQQRLMQVRFGIPPYVSLEAGAPQDWPPAQLSVELAELVRDEVRQIEARERIEREWSIKLTSLAVGVPQMSRRPIDGSSSRVDWKTTIDNSGPYPTYFDANAYYRDADGNTLHVQTFEARFIDTHASTVLSGDTLLDTEIADRVARVVVIITPRK